MISWLSFCYPLSGYKMESPYHFIAVIRCEHTASKQFSVTEQRDFYSAAGLG